MTSENKQTGAEPADSATEESVGASEQEVAEIVGRLAEPGDLERAERRRLLGRLTKSLAAGASKAKASGSGRSRWLADVFMAVAPRIPIRDLPLFPSTTRASPPRRWPTTSYAPRQGHHDGRRHRRSRSRRPSSPPRRSCSPPPRSSWPRPSWSPRSRSSSSPSCTRSTASRCPAAAPSGRWPSPTAWSKQRGVDPLSPASVTIALGAATKTAMRNRLMRTLGRHMTTLGPFLTGAVAGGFLNRSATRKLSEAVRADLRVHRALPPGKS